MSPPDICRRVNCVGARMMGGGCGARVAGGRCLSSSPAGRHTDRSLVLSPGGIDAEPVITFDDMQAIDDHAIERRYSVPAAGGGD